MWVTGQLEFVLSYLYPIYHSHHTKSYFTFPTKSEKEKVEYRYQCLKYLTDHDNQSPAQFRGGWTLKISMDRSCVSCAEIFPNPGKCNHQITEQGKCEQCGKSFDGKENLKVHELTHDKVEQHNCVQCNKSFIQASKLKTHMFAHGEEKQHKCTQCKYSTKDGGTLKTHIKNPRWEKQHTSQQCNKSFIQSSNLKTHLHPHWGEETQVHTMQLCI